MTHTVEWVRSWKPPKIVHGKLTKWNWIVLYPKNLKMGKCVDVGAFSLLECSNGVELGDFCELGSHVSIFSRSTIDSTKGAVKIGAFARVGSHTTVLPNVEIGDGAIVGAHSLVKTNIPELSLAYGVPAKVIKRI